MLWFWLITRAAGAAPLMKQLCDSRYDTSENTLRLFWRLIQNGVKLTDTNINIQLFTTLLFIITQTGCYSLENK